MPSFRKSCKSYHAFYPLLLEQIEVYPTTTTSAPGNPGNVKKVPERLRTTAQNQPGWFTIIFHWVILRFKLILTTETISLHISIALSVLYALTQVLFS